MSAATSISAHLPTRPLSHEAQWRPSVFAPDDLPVVRGLALDRATQQALEEQAAPRGVPPVEAELELGQVARQVLSAHATLIGAKQKAMQQGEHTMDGGQDFVCTLAGLGDIGRTVVAAVLLGGFRVATQSSVKSTAPLFTWLLRKSSTASAEPSSTDSKRMRPLQA